MDLFGEFKKTLPVPNIRGAPPDYDGPPPPYEKFEKPKTPMQQSLLSQFLERAGKSFGYGLCGSNKGCRDLVDSTADFIQGRKSNIGRKAGEYVVKNFPFETAVARGVYDGYRNSQKSKNKGLDGSEEIFAGAADFAGEFLADKVKNIFKPKTKRNRVSKAKAKVDA